MNHTSMVIRLDMFPGRVFSIEALKDGLHLWPLSSLVRKYDGDCYWYPIRPEYEIAGVDAARWLLCHLGTGYDVFDCLSNWRTILHIDPDPADARQLYCSESVFMAYREREVDEETQLVIGAGIPHLQAVKVSPVPGRPVLKMGIWKAHAAVTIMQEAMRKNFDQFGRLVAVPSAP